MSTTGIPNKASDFVVLEGVGVGPTASGLAPIDFIRHLPDGTNDILAGSFWRVPKKSVLVVKEVDWQYDYAAAAGTLQILRLFVYNLTTPATQFRAFESAIVLSPTGAGGGTFSMTNGFPVSPAAWIGVDMMPGPIGPPSGLQHLILRGFLIAA